MDLLLLGCLPVLPGLPSRRALLPVLQICHQAASASQLPGKQPHGVGAGAGGLGRAPKQQRTQVQGPLALPEMQRSARNAEN